ncbi:hypothetical protein GL325_10865 [Aeromicrobium sp. 636]|uniref:Phosphotyrosine protein phosphatase I domain-containing protein n=1 Tax=Aeromicrobium senzhongii TaxID=2663859 RepID=A0A8I0EVB6_9ACTN|nr:MULTISPECIES: hypothetical protein [Aeromicrobium]MBC9226829.1 hypothetical protein [Aeromicrobium senzhongii]MCQ3998929.1 hypothetical protein [Aeromicrobium sp. 636]MTB89576.1 hypothetical protein [Aeromicrobium senzhongii]QNL94297.1 hypothetical protein H9L21_14645 [Aeromicrobium senzhongii]
MSHGILVVCTANVCRSPVMEAMLAQLLDPTRFEVASAGVMAPRGTPIDPESAAQLRARNVPVPERTARQLKRDLVTAADLVLTATRAHRADVLDLDPRALRRTFTLVEFAALCTQVEATDFAGLVAAAATERSRGPRDVDLIDPIGQPTEVHAEVAARIETAVRTIAEVLGRLEG